MVYKLSATLSGHSQDVRCVASSSSLSMPSGTRILSSSRDKTARSWKLDEAGGRQAWIQDAVYAGHDNFVGAVTAATLSDGTQLAITGSNDATICVWPLLQAGPSSTSSPLKTLVGHAANVCALDAYTNLLASGSWDQTAKVWDLEDPSGQALLSLEGSELSIWAVKILPSSSSSSGIRTLTASADKIIRLYTGSSITRVFKGHTQPVRALCLLPESLGKNLFASAGNDGLIKIWDWESGSCVKTLDGHESFVYSLAALENGSLVSSGEDRSVRVWDKDTGALKQTITIPAISIWSVNILNGTDDIIVGSSDSQVRLFTESSDRQASAQDLATYEEAISSSAINSSQIGDVKKSDLKSESTLLERRGKKEGEIAMVKHSITGDVEAHQWSSAEGKWIKIGSVVDAVGSGRKQLYEGKEYDYVFDVDVEEGRPPLKLPYNATQNPYEAAQKFLTTYELPQSYVDQVVQFIEKNTGGATLGGQGGMDPYTGASSYRSSGATSAGNTQQNNNASFSGDPWSASSSSTSARPTTSMFPLKTFLSFTQANVSAASKKILDLHTALSNDITTATDFPMDTADITTLQSLVSSISTSPSNLAVDTATYTLLEKLLDWPSSSRFPVLDLIRIVAIHAPTSGLLFQLLNNVSPNPSASQKENETNAMLALRGIANLFIKDSASLVDNASEALETLSVIGVDGLNKNARIALATVALNYSVLAVEGKLPALAAAHLLDLIAALLADNEPETVYRAIVGFGNVVYSPDKVKGSVQMGTLQGLKSRAETLARSGEARTKDAVRDIVAKLS